MVDVGHRRAAIVEHGGGGAEVAALLDRRLRQAACGRLHDLQLGDGRLAQPGDLVEPLGAGGENLGEGAEPCQQRLGNRLDVPPRHRAEQDQLEELVVVEGRGAAPAEALAQPFAVAGEMRLGRRRGFGVVHAQPSAASAM